MKRTYRTDIWAEQGQMPVTSADLDVDRRDNDMGEMEGGE